MPLSRLDDLFKGSDLKIVFHIDGEVVGRFSGHKSGRVIGEPYVSAVLAGEVDWEYLSADR